MTLGLLLGEEQAGGLHHVLHAQLAPGDLLGVHLVKGLDLLAIDVELAVLGLGNAVKAAVDGVVLGHIGHVVGADKGVVHRDDLEGLGLGHRDAEHQSADAAEAIDANFDCHTNTRSFLLFGGSKPFLAYSTPFFGKSQAPC